MVALWQRNQALRQAEVARVALSRAEQVKSFIASIFTQAVPRVGHGGTVTAVDLLQSAARRVETDLSAQPEIAAELGLLIGSSFNELGQYRASLEWLSKVVERCMRTLGATHEFSLLSRCQLVYAANSMGELSVSEPLLPALIRDLRAVQPQHAELLVHALESQAFVLTKRGIEPAAIAALNEAVELASQRLGSTSATSLEVRASLSNTFAHFGRAGPALQAIEPAMEDAQSAFGALRPHPLLSNIERFYADALARNSRPREAATILRRVLADTRVLDVEDTTHVRIAMTFLCNALMQGGHLDEAQSLIAEADALHERLTGGANHEGIGLAGRHSLICSLRGDGPSALRHLARIDALAAASGETGALAVDHYPLRVLALATAGQAAEALSHADAMQAHFATQRENSRVRVHRARAMALRLAGSPASACEAAETAVSTIAGGDCSNLEHGLALVEAARCHLGAGSTAQAEGQWRAALSVWEAGQVDGAELIAPLRAEFASLHGPH